MKNKDDLVHFSNQVLGELDMYNENIKYKDKSLEATKVLTLKDTQDIIKGSLNNTSMLSLLDECDAAYDKRKEALDIFVSLVTTKIDKLTDEQLARLTEWFKDLK